MANIYHFYSLDSVGLKQIEGNAILLIGKESCEKVCLLKNNKLIIIAENDEIKKLMFPNSYGSDKVIQQVNAYLKTNKQEGTLNIQNNLYLELFVKDISFKYKFPYTKAVIYLSKDGKSISMHSFGQAKNNIHPLLKGYKDSNELLSLLRTLKSTTNMSLSVDFYQDGGIPIGFGMEKGRAHWIGIDKMIEIVLQAQHCIYHFIFEKIQKITSRFPESNLTPQKKNILDNFKSFCSEHAENGISRSELVENWANNYELSYGENPFDVLRKPRRTYTGLMSIFNPSKTDSILLFEGFLAKEEISKSLQEKMQQSSNLLANEKQLLTV